MKNNSITLLLFVLCVSGFSQINYGYDYRGRYTPTVKKEKVIEAKYISDIMPEFCRYFGLPQKERDTFNQLLKLEGSQQGNYSQKYFYHQEKFEKIIDYVLIDIMTICNGKLISTKSKSNIITAEQKNSLYMADLGTDISIKIKFKYKYPTNKFPNNDLKIQEGKYVVTVIPSTEAEYPGGFKQITNYVTQTIINKIPKTLSSEKIRQAIVKFTINEEGNVVDTKIAKTCTDLKIDQLLIDAISKMPKWKPAKNAKGIKVKQEYCIPLDGNGC